MQHLLAGIERLSVRTSPLERSQPTVKLAIAAGDKRVELDRDALQALPGSGSVRVVLHTDKGVCGE